MPNPLANPLLRWLGRLSYPRMFLVVAALFGINLLIPDMIPFVDEILLGLVTLLLANWKDRRKPADARAEGKVIDAKANRTR